MEPNDTIAPPPSSRSRRVSWLEAQYRRSPTLSAAIDADADDALDFDGFASEALDED